MKQQLYICACNSAEHQMIFNPDPLDEKLIYVEINLVRKSFIDRLIYGIKYIFGYQSKYGAFEEIVLNKDHAEQLREASCYLDPEGTEKYLNSTFKAWNGLTA